FERPHPKNESAYLYRSNGSLKTRSSRARDRRRERPCGPTTRGLKRKAGLGVDSDQGPRKFSLVDQLTAHLERGWDLAQRGDTRGAASSARRALELDPDSPEVHNLLGFVAALEGDCEEAVEAYQQAVLLDDSYVEAMLNAAELLVHPMARYDEALR